MTHSIAPLSQTSILRLEEYNRIYPTVPGTNVAGLVSMGILLVIGFLGSAFYWTTFSKLDGAVVATGSFVVEGNRKTIDHLEGGIVREIRVGNGDLVEAGEVLLTLDNTALDVDLDVVTSQITDLTARRVRLLAQLQGADNIEESDFMEALRISLKPTDWQADYSAQKLLFDAQMRSRQAEIALRDQRIKSLCDRIHGLQVQRASVDRQLEITHQELRGLEALLDKGLVAAPRVNARRVEREALVGEAIQLRSQEEQFQNEINALQLADVAAQTLREETLSAELAQVEASLATLEPQYFGAVERLSRVEVLAPVSGRVVEMTAFTTGGVIRPGVPILDIVPENQPLLVEARINTADIEKIYIGQASRIRLSAFDYADVPEVEGHIVGISADSLEDERTGQHYYLARVHLGEDQPADIAALDLVPGMPADLFVNTGERTMLSYLTQPINERLARTFVE
ncbi:MAG: HlyD family type I secretion periplasmic adaptor subunit [Pseudomonadota bacterium]